MVVGFIVVVLALVLRMAEVRGEGRLQGEELLRRGQVQEPLSAEELLRRYTRSVFAQTGSIEETARRLDLDRRTVKARLG